MEHSSIFLKFDLELCFYFIGNIRKAIKLKKKKKNGIRTVQSHFSPSKVEVAMKLLFKL